METSFFPPPLILHLDVDGVRKEAQASPDGHATHQDNQRQEEEGDRNEVAAAFGRLRWCGWTRRLRTCGHGRDLLFHLLVIPTFSRAEKFQT